ncbi:unnamed protein product [Dracunculus medinensis]|uniref:Uncharacterized protein n=1 Tax=Dracunculus medinensis TaxID=318479 RepID=A0A0N4UD39_DRAME|nr:unnamed protein product [Dracunculus medinensis]
MSSNNPLYGRVPTRTRHNRIAMENNLERNENCGKISSIQGEWISPISPIIEGECESVPKNHGDQKKEYRRVTKLPKSGDFVAKENGSIAKSPHRMSSTSLAVEDNEEGRMSPISPIIERFNSKTSQYRSFNMKKMSERNQKVLEQLANLRLQLKQKQQQMEQNLNIASGLPIRRIRTPTNDKSSDEVIATI